VGGIRGAQHALIGAIHQLHHSVQERRWSGKVVQARICRETADGPEQQKY
jgi:hypothetical protein